MDAKRGNRLWRHVLADDVDVRRSFPPDALDRVEALIRAGESRHTGEVCVAIEPALPVGRVWRHVPPRDRALEVFGLLRVWDTEHNNGVLIYLLLADRHFEIIADRGIHRHVGAAGWEAIARQMAAIFAERRPVAALEHGVGAINELLVRHFPGDDRDPNELPNRPVLLA
jgi:uncharacterized membrane protein